MTRLFARLAPALIPTAVVLWLLWAAVAIALTLRPVVFVAAP